MKKIVITKPGYNADTETDPRNINFSSELPSLKYYASGSIDVTGGAGYTTVEFSHNLGYIPFFVAYIGPILLSDDFAMIPFVYADFTDFFHGAVWADSTKLYFQIWHNLGSSPTATFYYKIFRNRTNL